MNNDPIPYTPDQIGQLPDSGDPRLKIDYYLRVIKALLGSGNGGDVAPSATVTINLPGNRIPWLPTGIYVAANSATVIRATGAICHNQSDPLYGPTQAGFAYMAWRVGAEPTEDNPPDEKSYLNQRDVDDTVLGQIWLHIHDIGGSGDNRGSFDVTLTQWANASVTSAVARVNRARLDVLTNRN